jgi:hypothetical protein
METGATPVLRKRARYRVIGYCMVPAQTSGFNSSTSDGG